MVCCASFVIGQRNYLFKIYLNYLLKTILKPQKSEKKEKSFVMAVRCGRIAMLMALSVCYPQYLFVLQLLVILEVAGGWSHHFR